MLTKWPHRWKWFWYWTAILVVLVAGMIALAAQGSLWWTTLLVPFTMALFCLMVVLRSWYEE